MTPCKPRLKSHARKTNVIHSRLKKLKARRTALDRAIRSLGSYLELADAEGDTPPEALLTGLSSKKKKSD